MEGACFEPLLSHEGLTMFESHQKNGNQSLLKQAAAFGSLANELQQLRSLRASIATRTR
jgi:hypothetical protein